MNVTSAKCILRERFIQRKSFWIEKLKTLVPLGLNIYFFISSGKANFHLELVELINILNHTKDLITALTRFLISSVKIKKLTVPYPVPYQHKLEPT